jgi:hypothetical protein
MNRAKMQLPMQHEALQQHTKGAPLTNCTPTHLNVPKKWHNKMQIVKTKRISISNMLSSTQKQPSIHDFLTKMITRVSLVLIPNGGKKKKKNIT